MQQDRQIYGCQNIIHKVNLVDFTTYKEPEPRPEARRAFQEKARGPTGPKKSGNFTMLAQGQDL